MRDKKIEMAKTTRVDSHRAIARDFMRRILDLDEGDYLISDESKLWDFSQDDERDGWSTQQLQRRVERIYGVVTDRNDHLVDIFDAISRRGVL